jgi:hypothetical protein
MSVGADSNAANRKVGELLSHQRMMGEAKVIFAEAKSVCVQLQLDRNAILEFCKFGQRWRQK